MLYDNFIEKMGGPKGREVCHENFTGESGLKLVDKATVSTMFPGVQLSSSDYVAYLPAIMCRSLPVVNIRGRCFTPRVMAKSAASARDGIVDVEHVLRDNDFARDVVIGSIKAVSFGGGAVELANDLPLVPTEAMPLSVLLALHMRIGDTPRILEAHLSGKELWATSMECYYDWKNCAYWYEGEFIPVPDAPPDMHDCVTPTKVEPYRGKKLAIALGGMESSIDYCGIALTSSPADKGSSLMALMAGRCLASDGKRRYFPVTASIKKVDYQNSEQALEIASEVADQKLKDIAAIEVLGQTSPADDGHTHDVLTDGTVMPSQGHTHYLPSFQLVRGTNPRFTGRTSEHFYPAGPDASYMQAPTVHFHLLDIPLRGGKKKDTSDPVTDVASVLEGCNTLSDLEEAMASKLSDLLAKLEKAISVSPVKSVANDGVAQPNAALESVLTELRSFKLEDDIKSEAQKQVADMTTRGEILTKTEHERKVAEAVAAKEKELNDKQAAEKAAAARLDERLGKITALGVELDYTPEGKDKSIRQQFSGYAFDESGEALFQSDLRTLAVQVELEKERAKQKAAAEQAATQPTPALANDGKKPAPKKSFLIGGSSEEPAKQLASTGKAGGKGFLDRY